MDVSRPIEGYDCTRQCNQTLDDAPEEDLTLTLLTGLLDDALRMWDQDRIVAKSQIKVAAAMLRGALTNTKEEASRNFYEAVLRPGRRARSPNSSTRRWRQRSDCRIVRNRLG